MALDHAGIQVSDLARSRVFYTDALAPLGIVFIKELGGYLGFGENGYAELWLGQVPRPAATHLAFQVANRETVRRFYASAVAAGGTPKHAPQIFDIYHPDFYAAMVFDPDGNNIEVVCHVPDKHLANGSGLACG